MCGVPRKALTPAARRPSVSTSSPNRGHPRRMNSSASVVLPAPPAPRKATTPSGESTALACRASYPRIMLTQRRTFSSSARCQAICASALWYCPRGAHSSTSCSVRRRKRARSCRPCSAPGSRQMNMTSPPCPRSTVSAKPWPSAPVHRESSSCPPHAAASSCEEPRVNVSCGSPGPPAGLMPGSGKLESSSRP